MRSHRYYKLMKKSNILHLTNTYELNVGAECMKLSNFYKYQKQNGLNPTIWYPEETDLQNVLDKNHIKSLPTYNFYNYSVLKILEKQQKRQVNLT